MGTDSFTYFLPTLTVNNAIAAISFYEEAFGAQVLTKNTFDGHTVAELSINNAVFIVADESPENRNIGPDKQNGISVRMGLMVQDPDAVAGRAIAAGINVIYPVSDQSYGYRLGHFIDPFGHHWEIGKPLYL
ncbi:VOC family protein [Mucilaginibacter litoreus]|uniref:VOC family protein n=1 Tax=Mucilaginibacter litoreus TaxID=1048221 RepID=A0ABW3ASZ0_9SPHI